MIIISISSSSPPYHLHLINSICASSPSSPPYHLHFYRIIISISSSPSPPDQLHLRLITIIPISTLSSSPSPLYHLHLIIIIIIPISTLSSSSSSPSPPLSESKGGTLAEHNHYITAGRQFTLVISVYSNRCLFQLKCSLTPL